MGVGGEKSTIERREPRSFPALLFSELFPAPMIMNSSVFSSVLDWMQREHAKPKQKEAHNTTFTHPHQHNRSHPSSR